MASFRILRAIICCLLIGITVASLFSTAANAIIFESAPEGLFGSIGPTVYGDDQFKDNIDDAMGYLRENYPDDYARVIYWVSEIKPTDTYTRIDNYGVCYIDADDANASYYWLAGVLLHEAQHTYDDNIYFLDHSYSAHDSEARALDVQATYLGSVNGWTGDQIKSWVDGYLQTAYWETIPVKYGDSPLK